MKLKGDVVEVEVVGDGVRPVESGPPDLSSMPGARIVLSGAWERGRIRSDAACVAIPVLAWVPGLEAALVDGASARVRAEGRLDELQPQALVREHRGYTQSFTGRRSGVEAVGRHLIGFIEQGREVVACTMLCSESSSPSDRGRCEEEVTRARFHAAFVDEPPPGLVVRVALTAAERPALAAGAAAVTALLLVALILRARPRPGRLS